MSWFTNFFSPHTTTNANTSQQQQQQQSGSNQSNLWGQLGQYFPGYAATAFNPAPFNQYQLGAASSQSGLVPGLTPGFQAAGNIAQGGISTGDIDRFRVNNQGYLDALRTNFEAKNAQEQSQNAAQAAKLGAITGSGTQTQRLLTEKAQHEAQDPIVQKALWDAQQNAQQMAAQSTQAQLGGASALGSLTGAATGANQAGFGMGQQLYRNPLEWQGYGLEHLSPFLQGAGQNYTGQGSGSSTGQSGSTTTTTPSPFGIGALIGGLAGQVPWGQLAGTMGTGLAFHDGGRVPTFAEGGTIARPQAEAGNFADKVRHAFTAFHDMRKQAQGGAVKGFDWGGTVADPTEGQEKDSWSGFGSALGKAGNTLGIDDKTQAAMAAANDKALAGLGRQQDALSQFMTRMRPPQAQGFKDGGEPVLDPYAGASDAPVTAFDEGLQALGRGESPLGAPRSGSWAAPAPSGVDSLEPRESFMPPPSRLGGPPADTLRSAPTDTAKPFYNIWTAPNAASVSPWARFGHGLLEASGPLLGAGIAKNATDYLEKLRHERETDLRAAELLGQIKVGDKMMPTLPAQIATGTVNGTQTLTGAKQAEDIRRANLPVWGEVKRDMYGQPVMGWKQPNFAPPEVQYTPPGAAPSGSAPAAPPAPRAAAGPAPDYTGAAYAPTKEAVELIPPGQKYFTPEHVAKGLPPEVKPEPGTPSPAAVKVTDKNFAKPAATPGVSIPKSSTDDDDLALLQGREFLDALGQRHGPAVAKTVEDWVSGKAQPAPATVRSPMGQRMLLWARQADPNFNEMTWPIRQRVMKDFAGNGQNAQQIKSAGTLVGHLNTLYELIPQLHNRDWPASDIGRRYFSNPIAEGVQKGPGGYADVLNRYNDTRLKVAQELTKLMAGGRGGTVEEVKAAEEAFDPTKSESTLKGAVKNAIGLMDSRLIEVNRAWNMGFAGSSQEMPSHRGWLDPEHQRILNRVVGNREGVIYANPLANPNYSAEKAARRDEPNAEGAPSPGWTVKRVE